MIQDFNKYLFGKSNPAYHNWLFPQSKSTLKFGLIATVILNIALSIGDYFYYEEALKNVSIQEWVWNWNNVPRLILFPIINLAAILLAISKWNNQLARLEFIGILTISFAVCSNLYMSITNDYFSSDDFALGILPFMIISQMIYGLSFRTSFILNITAIFLIFIYSAIAGTPILQSIWTYNMVILTWGSILLGSLKLEQHRIHNFNTISDLAQSNLKLGDAHHEIEAQKQLLRSGEKVSKMFSWKASKDLKDISYSDGVFDILEIDANTNSFKEVLKIMKQRFHPDDKAMVLKQMKDLEKGIISGLEAYRIILPNGNIKWLNTSVDDKSNEKYFLGTIQDVTKEKTLQLELQSQTIELKLINTDLQQFAYASSHDLQEPLRTITNFVSILDKKISAQLIPEHRNYMNLIMDSAGRMSELILAILEYSRIGIEKNLEQLDCNAIVENVKKDLNYSIEQSGGQIIIETSLPTIFSFRAEFTTLFQNLIGNALKFRKEDVAPIIIIRSYSDKDAHHFSIEDNGIGMEQKYANKIFQLFSRLHNKEQYSGTGIGLTHCKKIVELHGGKIWVESTIGNGTVFHFYISKNLKPKSLAEKTSLHLID